MRVPLIFEEEFSHNELKKIFSSELNTVYVHLLPFLSEDSDKRQKMVEINRGEISSMESMMESRVRETTEDQSISEELKDRVFPEQPIKPIPIPEPIKPMTPRSLDNKGTTGIRLKSIGKGPSQQKFNSDPGPILHSGS